MKKPLLLILLFVSVGVKAQVKHSNQQFSAGSLSPTTDTSKVFAHGKENIFLTPSDPNQVFSYLMIVGKINMPYKNSYLLIVKDTSKFSIKLQDTIFVIHMSPKFVKRINDSTYTFKNK